MAKKEVKTDLWVASMLHDSGIEYTAQGSDVKEIDAALKTASKCGTGNVGYPEYTAVVDNFALVIEDKSDPARQELKTDKGILDTSVKATIDEPVIEMIRAA